MAMETTTVAAWQWALLGGSVLCLFLILCFFISLSIRTAKQSNEEQAALRAQLNSTNGEPGKQRQEVAIQVADSGYIVCPNCAFENFTTVTSCTICKTPLTVAAK